MFALFLWVTLSWRAAAVELSAELAIGIALLGGGGGRRFRRALRDFAELTLRLRRPAPGF